MDLSLFYLAKNHKIDGNSTTTEAGEKNTDLESLDIKKKIVAGFNKFKNNHIFLNKLSQ